MILRPGFVSKEMLEEVLGEVCVDPTILDANSKERPKAPGMRYRHYAPKADMVIVRGDRDRVVAKIKEMGQNKECTVLCVSEHVKMYDGMKVKDVGSENDYNEIAASLYRVLRECDDENTTLILSESFSDKGIGAAVMNRLIKAAGHKIIDV